MLFFGLCSRLEMQGENHMTKYILLYQGLATDMADMTEEQQKAVTDKWAEWMAKVGSALVDVGQPMANGVAIVDDGSEGSAGQLNGYSIIQADNLDQARALVDGHPFLTDKSGKFSVLVYELLPVPGM